MPNHITNVIRGDREVLAQVCAAMKTDESAIDFNALIPMPELLRSDSADIGITELANCFMGRQAMTTPGPQDARGLPEERFEKLLIYMRSIREHGFPTWYEWSIEHWGTKWNAYSVQTEDDGLNVRFDTAWSCPMPVARALAKAVPSPWSWLYADEDIGSNCGTIHCRGGELVRTKPEDPTGFALKLKGWDPEEYYAETEESRPPPTTGATDGQV